MTRRWTLSPRLLLAVLAIGALVASAVALASPLEPIVLDAALVAHVTGMLAGYGAAVMMILMSRSPAIEHGVGSDRLARWHSRMGPMVIGLAVVHALAALDSWAGVRGVGLITATREVLGWPGLFAAALGLVLLVVVGLGSLRWVRRQMPYEHWHLFHMLAYVAVALGSPTSWPVPTWSAAGRCRSAGACSTRTPSRWSSAIGCCSRCTSCGGTG